MIDLEFNHVARRQPPEAGGPTENYILSLLQGRKGKIAHPGLKRSRCVREVRKG